jgi:hypothetical protein
MSAIRLGEGLYPFSGVVEAMSILLQSSRTKNGSLVICVAHKRLILAKYGISLEAVMVANVEKKSLKQVTHIEDAIAAAPDHLWPWAWAKVFWPKICDRTVTDAGPLEGIWTPEVRAFSRTSQA